MGWLNYILFIFILYSFLGWVLEEVYCFVITGDFKEDGFLSGPFKPMYGVAISIIVYFSEFTSVSNIVLWILLLVVPTLIEFISGYLLKRIFNKEYWDYSKVKFNVRGIVCLKFSLYWTVLVAFVVYILQPLVEIVYYQSIGIFSMITPIFAIYLLSDFIVTYNIKQKKII